MGAQAGDLEILQLLVARGGRLDRSIYPEGVGAYTDALVIARQARNSDVVRWIERELL